MPSRPTVLVVAPADEALRGYCLDSVAAAYDVVLITASAPTWERRCIRDVEIADPADETALLAAGQTLAGRHTLYGVVTWSEWDLVNVARLAEHLGLRTNTPQVMRDCRNKGRQRTLFARHRVPSAKAMTARTLLEAALAAETIGYPVVLKPAAYAASIGVSRITRSEQLPGGFDFAQAGAERSRESTAVLVEEYLDGPEISVECVTHRGTTSAVAVTRKTLGIAPYFEELAHSVDANDPLLVQVGSVAASAVRALGLTDGVQHVEMRLTDAGPRLVEVNARIAGDLIGHLVHLATGIDLPRAAADIACGTTPDLTRTRRTAAGIRLLYPDVSGTLTARHLSEGFADHTPWLRQVHWLREVGDAVTLPPAGSMYSARVGFFTVTGSSTRQVEQRTRLVLDQLTLTTTPTPQRPTPGRSCLPEGGACA
ncbi:ATP-grasp domain-containing protein [Streptomyces niveus]|uniref:ATP-grasp domain-containing protein n=1 Tax=Streptomyces niveus TaxID=193462 RepID=UPI0007C76F3C|nr:ATP-grasp domain-containing protein [Streptomyces niveus]